MPSSDNSYSKLLRYSLLNLHTNESTHNYLTEITLSHFVIFQVFSNLNIRLFCWGLYNSYYGSRRKNQVHFAGGQDYKIYCYILYRVICKPFCGEFSQLVYKSYQEGWPHVSDQVTSPLINSDSVDILVLHHSSQAKNCLPTCAVVPFALQSERIPHMITK